jgi:hypothetical protein
LVTAAPVFINLDSSWQPRTFKEMVTSSLKRDFQPFPFFRGPNQTHSWKALVAI